MANTINWGISYCSSWFGDDANQFSINIDSKPTCL